MVTFTGTFVGRVVGEDPGPTPPDPMGHVLYDVSFDHLDPGPFRQAEAAATFGAGTALDWEPPPDDWWEDAGFSVVRDEETGDSVLEQVIRAGATGGGGGAVFNVPIPETVACVYRHEIKFVEGFDVNEGGKTPGVGSTNNEANPPTGGQEPTNGFSARHQWRTGGEAGDRPPGSVAVYTYHPDKATQWGDYEFVEAAISVGDWHTQTTGIVLNTPGEENGVLVSRMDTAQWTLKRNDYLWRPDASWVTNRFMYAVFRGGDETWASERDGRIRFRSFRIYAPAPVLSYRV